MIANLIIIAFLIGMSYWWSTQGLFSAFIHLGLTIVAGSIALAIWEPLSMGLLMKVIPTCAWGVGLLAPFLVVLIVLRLAADKLVPRNMQFMGIISSSVGGTLGFFSGILTAGIAVIGLGFMPLDASLAGYQPYVTAPQMSGEAQILRVIDNEESGLWVPVDRMAERFFTSLSDGAFAPWSGKSMGEYAPNLSYQAGIFRMRNKSSVVALPDHVKIDNVYARPTPFDELVPEVAVLLGAAAAAPNQQIIVVDTLWTFGKVTYEKNQTAYIPPTQIQLVTEKTAGTQRQVQFHTPIAYEFVRPGEEDAEQRTIVPFDTDGSSAYATETGTEKIGWVFIVPADQTPRFLLVRHLRLELPRPSGYATDPQQVVMALGVPVPEEEPEQVADADGGADGGAQGEVGPRDGPRTGQEGIEIEVSNTLPRHLSRNLATGLEYNDQDQVIVSGDSLARKAPSSIGQRNSFNSFYVPSHKEMVRLKVRRDRAQSFLGAALTSAASLGGVFLVDDKGNRVEPIGYCLEKANGDMKIKFDPGTKITSARQLPISEMTGQEYLYLYFMVNPGTQIVSYEIGEHTQQDVNLTVE